MIKTIYIDMDGVLVDLERELEKLEGIEIAYARTIYAKPGFDVVMHLITKWIDHKPFLTAPPMQNVRQVCLLMDKLKEQGFNVQILSSGTKNAELFDRIVEQKKQWLHRWGFNFPAIFARGGSTKCELANESTLLIDDDARNCELFKERGGHVILYKDDMNLPYAAKQLGLPV